MIGRAKIAKYLPLSPIDEEEILLASGMMPKSGIVAMISGKKVKVIQDFLVETEITTPMMTKTGMMIEIMARITMF